MKYFSINNVHTRLLSYEQFSCKSLTGKFNCFPLTRLPHDITLTRRKGEALRNLVPLMLLKKVKKTHGRVPSISKMCCNFIPNL